MRIQPLLVAALVSAVSDAAKSKGSQNVFERYLSKGSSGWPFKIDDSLFDELTKTPRDHGTIVCLTALAPQLGCKACHDLRPEWDVLAKSWANGDSKGESRTLFATLDFETGRQTFQSLQLETAPVILYYPPTSGPNASPSASPRKFEFVTAPTADTIHAWLSRQLPESAPKPRVVRPINWVRTIFISTLVVGGITGLVVAWPYVSFVLQNRNVWASFSIVAILLFTSGHMFNHIRGTPYISGDGKGGITYFAGGFQNQFGMESQIVAAMYGVLAFATISLALKVPRIQDPKTQQVAVFIWGGVMYGMYSFLLSIFKIKNAGYPYTLPPF